MATTVILRLDTTMLAVECIGNGDRAHLVRMAEVTIEQLNNLSINNIKICVLHVYHEADSPSFKKQFKELEKRYPKVIFTLYEIIHPPGNIFKTEDYREYLEKDPQLCDVHRDALILADISTPFPPSIFDETRPRLAYAEHDSSSYESAFHPPYSETVLLPRLVSKNLREPVECLPSPPQIGMRCGDLQTLIVTGIENDGIILTSDATEQQDLKSILKALFVSPGITSKTVEGKSLLEHFNPQGLSAEAYLQSKSIITIYADPSTNGQIIPCLRSYLTNDLEEGCCAVVVIAEKNYTPLQLEFSRLCGEFPDSLRIMPRVFYDACDYKRIIQLSRVAMMGGDNTFEDAISCGVPRIIRIRPLWKGGVYRMYGLNSLENTPELRGRIDLSKKMSSVFSSAIQFRRFQSCCSPFIQELLLKGFLTLQQAEDLPDTLKEDQDLSAANLQLNVKAYDILSQLIYENILANYGQRILFQVSTTILRDTLRYLPRDVLVTYQGGQGKTLLHHAASCGYSNKELLGYILPLIPQDHLLEALYKRSNDYTVNTGRRNVFTAGKTPLECIQDFLSLQCIFTYLKDKQIMEVLTGKDSRQASFLSRAVSNYIDVMDHNGGWREEHLSCIERWLNLFPEDERANLIMQRDKDGFNMLACINPKLKRLLLSKLQESDRLGALKQPNDPTGLFYLLHDTDVELLSSMLKLYGNDEARAIEDNLDGLLIFGLLDHPEFWPLILPFISLEVLEANISKKPQYGMPLEQRFPLQCRGILEKHQELRETQLASDVAASGPPISANAATNSQEAGGHTLTPVLPETPVGPFHEAAVATNSQLRINSLLSTRNTLLENIE